MGTTGGITPEWPNSRGMCEMFDLKSAPNIHQTHTTGKKITKGLDYTE